MSLPLVRSTSIALRVTHLRSEARHLLPFVLSPLFLRMSILQILFFIYVG